ncbi:MAG TPA: GDSL-type esterase/lipase family protein [bacterium]|nr:GDSL-type esterase/lipase family protein [bacterium]
MTDPATTSPIETRQSLLRSLGGIAAVIVLFLLAEALCLALARPSRLDRILMLLERDAQLMWRLRADLSTTFEGAAVTTSAHHLRGPDFAVPKPAGVRRIVCLGASPTFGWGVAEDKTYPAVLGTLLRERGLNVETINGGVPGYTTWQGKHFLARDVLGWQPDLVTVAYDLNDLDIFRFFSNNGLPDAQQQPTSARIVAAQNLLNHSAAYRFFRNTLIGALVKRGSFDPERMPRRVSLADYQANLHEIERQCREHNIQVVFIKMPINLPFYRLQVVNAAQAASAFAQGRVAETGGDWPQAIAQYRRSMELDSTQSSTYIHLARALQRVGRLDEADGLYAMLPFVSAFRERTDAQYNQAVVAAAAQTGRAYVDAVGAFAADGRGDGLWNSKEDPFHPNAAGHAIVAGLLADVISPLPGNEEPTP